MKKILCAAILVCTAPTYPMATPTILRQIANNPRTFVRLTSTHASSHAHDVKGKEAALEKLKEISTTREILFSETASKLGVSATVTAISPLVSAAGIELMCTAGSVSSSARPSLVIAGLLAGLSLTIGGSVRSVRGLYKTAYLIPPTIRSYREWRHAVDNVQTAEEQLDSLKH